MIKDIIQAYKDNGGPVNGQLFMVKSVTKALDSKGSPYLNVLYRILPVHWMRRSGLSMIRILMSSYQEASFVSKDFTRCSKDIRS